MKRLLLLVLPAALLSACSPLGKRAITRELQRFEKEGGHHAGLVIYSPDKKKNIFDYKGDKYFTPASNTKILTFFTALSILGDSLPGLAYHEVGDSLIFWGLGDPSFLYKDTHTSDRVYGFLKTNTRNLYFSDANFYSSHFGPGWAWDDYTDYYSSERSPFPVYGNCFSVYPLPDKLLAVPTFFQKYGSVGEPAKAARVVRDLVSNKWIFQPGTDGRFRTLKVPFRTSADVTVRLLADTLQRPVGLVSVPKPAAAKVLFSVPSDSVYKVMMQQSDNFIAEQLLLMCSSVLSDSLKPEIAIRRMQKEHFFSMGNQPAWVDGSGLSRYNLFTPRFVVSVWERIYSMRPKERLFPLLASGGKPGTLRNWYKDPEPFVYGKTGTLSNNHSVSGYLVTKRGKILIFAFMNSNFVTPVSEVRRKMEKLLKRYYEHY